MRIPLRLRKRRYRGSKFRCEFLFDPNWLPSPLNSQVHSTYEAVANFTGSKPTRVRVKKLGGGFHVMVSSESGTIRETVPCSTCKGFTFPNRMNPYYHDRECPLVIAYRVMES